MTGCLMIHGFTGGPDELAPLEDHLKQHTDWQIEVPVLPGHGKHLDLHDVSHRKWIETAETTLKRLQQQHDTIYLIGFSMGGMIASYLAASYKIDKLVLLAAAGKFLAFRQLAADFSTLALDAVQGRAGQNRLYLHLQTKLPPMTWTAVSEFLHLVRLGRKHLKHVTVPVLIGQGLRDGLVPYQTAYYLEKQLGSRHKKVVLIEKARHFICLGEDRHTLNRLVLQFLSE